MDTKRAFSAIAVASVLLLGVVGCFRQKASSNELRSYFPEKTGFTWVYSGFAEYGHRMILDSITEVRSKGDVVHQISGMVEDMSGGESEQDFGFQLQYVFGGNEVVERILHKGVVFPHRIDGLVMLKAPLEKGQKTSEQSLSLKAQTGPLLPRPTRSSRQTASSLSRISLQMQAESSVPTSSGCRISRTSTGLRKKSTRGWTRL
jgi:hypothetical protein